MRFDFAGNRTTAATEVLAGCTTFLATMYIIVVNPAILAKAGMDFPAVLTATVLVSAFASLAMGLYANNPIVLAPGMGMNAFFTYSVVLGSGVPWATALGAVFWAGVLFLLLSVTKVRSRIVRAIPVQLRYGVAAGIGLFICLIGFANAGFVVGSPATIITRGPLDADTLTFLAGLGLTAVLLVRRVPGALVLGIAATTLMAVPLGRLWGEAVVVRWQGMLAPPDFSLFGRLDLAGSLKLSIWPVIFAFAFTDMFDSLATFVGVAEAGDLKDENGDPRNIHRSLVVDALGTVAAALCGSSPATSYIESATGIREGGRTGLTAVVAGLCFLPFMFCSPLLSIVPAVATAPALVLVGVYMIAPVASVDWRELDEAIPAFLAMFCIPVTYSITQGIVWGFLSWTLLKVAGGRWREVPLTLWCIDGFALLALITG